MTSRYQLEKCTPQSCKQCDLGYIIKDHVKTLMQLFDDDLKEYNMQLITSKCLNTAVLIMYLFLGKYALHITNQCDVPTVENAYKEKDMSEEQVAKFKRSVLNISSKTRQLYYVMMTDATLTHADDNKKTTSFPGHVFVIEKIPRRNKQSKPYYYIYQSYINKYDFNGAVQRNRNSLKVSYEKLSHIVDDIEYVFTNGVWDQRVVKLWNELAFVDSTEFLNHVTRGSILFCYRMIKIKDCANVLRKLLANKLKDLKTNSKYTDNPSAIYNNVRSYYAEDKPLTVSEIIKELDIMLQKIDNEFGNK